MGSFSQSVNRTNVWVIRRWQNQSSTTTKATRFARAKQTTRDIFQTYTVLWIKQNENPKRKEKDYKSWCYIRKCSAICNTELLRTSEVKKSKVTSLMIFSIKKTPSTSVIYLSCGVQTTTTERRGHLQLFKVNLDFLKYRFTIFIHLSSFWTC